MTQPSRTVSDEGFDDTLLPFAVEPLDVRGRVVRLGPSIDRILSRHGYPAPIARLLGEAAALTCMLGATLEKAGRFQLQTRSDGIADMLVVDFDAPDRLRAFARFDAAKLAAAEGAGRIDPATLLGHGHLAFTIDQGPEAARYQGVVALENDTLESAAHRYFRQSEQIPTLVRLAVGETLEPGGSHWRAGGLIVQFLPDSPERQRRADLDPGNAPTGTVKPEEAIDDAWNEARTLAGTVEDHELVDPTLSGERLLYRLFHERGVKVFGASPVHDKCRCSRDSVANMLRSFPPEERRDMVGDDGKIGVTCEFCSTKREFDPAEFDTSESDESDSGTSDTGALG